MSKLNIFNISTLSFIFILTSNFAFGGLFDLFSRGNNAPESNYEKVMLGNTELLFGTIDLTKVEGGALWFPIKDKKVEVLGNMNFFFSSSRNSENEKSVFKNNFNELFNGNPVVAETFLIESTNNRFSYLGVTHLPYNRPHDSFYMLRNSIYQFCIKSAEKGIDNLVISPNEYIQFANLGSKLGASAVLAGIALAIEDGAQLKSVRIGGYYYDQLDREFIDAAKNKEYKKYSLRNAHTDGFSIANLFTPEYGFVNRINFNYDNNINVTLSSELAGKGIQRTGNIDFSFSSDTLSDKKLFQVTTKNHTGVTSSRQDGSGSYEYYVINVEFSYDFESQLRGIDDNAKVNIFKQLFVDIENEMKSDLFNKQKEFRFFLPSNLINIFVLNNEELFNKLIANLIVHNSIKTEGLSFTVNFDGTLNKEELKLRMYNTASYIAELLSNNGFSYNDPFSSLNSDRNPRSDQAMCSKLF